tara:strand:- start:1022 stop:1558 length:537 start_codon:yes stop_codon:yes gene_type:complete
VNPVKNGGKFKGSNYAEFSLILNVKYADLNIISGGQTGVDRAALEFAMEHNFNYGGFCPNGRIAEDGRIPRCYNLIEIPESDYSYRTKLNVFQSDGTLIIYNKKIKNGTYYTYKVCLQADYPVFLIDIDLDYGNTSRLKNWINRYKINTLNIAGCRESESPYIFNRTKALLNCIFKLQ